MSEVTTRLVSVEQKPGESENGPYTLFKFTAADGKKYQTFNEELGAKISNQLLNVDGLVVVFEVNSRKSRDGTRTFTNNMMSDAYLAASKPVSGSAGTSSGRSSSTVTPNGKLVALEAAVQVVVHMVDSGQLDSFNGAAILSIADGFVAWANGTLAGSDPEDAVPDADPSEAVPD